MAIGAGAISSTAISGLQETAAVVVVVPDVVAPLYGAGRGRQRRYGDDERADPKEYELARLHLEADRLFAALQRQKAISLEQDRILELERIRWRQRQQEEFLLLLCS